MVRKPQLTDKYSRDFYCFFTDFYYFICDEEASVNPKKMRLYSIKLYLFVSGNLKNELSPDEVEIEGDIVMSRWMYEQMVAE